MLELPDAERCEQKAFRARESAHRGRRSLGAVSSLSFAGTTALPLGSADAASGLTDREMTGIIHGCLKSSFRASEERWGNGEMEWWSNAEQSCRRFSTTPLLQHSIFPIVPMGKCPLCAALFSASFPGHG